MDFLSQTYVALRGPTGAPQTAADTIGRLADRLSPSTLLQDRRAAVLSLKGLTRDHKQDVGDHALDGLLEVLYNDAEVDADIGKAVLETLVLLVDTEDAREVGLKFTDAMLKTERPVHVLFALLADNGFYLRLTSLQLLSALLQNRRQQVQSYFLTAPVGATSVLGAIDDKREIIRNEAISMLQLLLSQSPDIQKILAFQGAFEKCFNIISQEGGVEGGIATQEVLICVDTLLRYNNSNQSYFRETGLPPTLCQLLLFPPNTPLDMPAPQEFALQFWDAPKLANAGYVVGIMGLLVNSKGGSVVETGVFIRCLLEISLASNAPTSLKTQALKLLPHSLNFPLGNLHVTPYVPVLETNGEEWDKLEPTSALDTLVELALHGEYQGQDGSKQTKEGLELRTAAVGVFENFVRREEIRSAIVQAMASNSNPTPLLEAVCSPPGSHTPLYPISTTTTQFACLLFAHLLRSSLQSKSAARTISPKLNPPNPSGEGGFFVPADGALPPKDQAEEEDEDDDDDGPQTILQILNENLTLAFLTRSRALAENGDRECDRLIVGYLSLLSQWLWDDPSAVREFLNAGGLGSLVEAINSTGSAVDGEDFLVPGLCAFLLGVVYEFNREPGEVTRHTIYPILNRLSVDVLVSRLGRVREDERFKNTGPENLVLPFAGSGSGGEVWFDWSFVDFFKSNYFTIQRGFSTEPDQMSPGAGETAVLVASLREVIGRQSEEINLLRSQLQQVESVAAAAAAQPPPSAAPPTPAVVDTAKLEKEKEEAVSKIRNEMEAEKGAAQAQITQLKSDLDSLSTQLQSSEQKRKDVEKEQEDLLVLLDELSSKRSRDKQAMRGAGLQVSEDEDTDSDDDDDEEDE